MNMKGLGSIVALGLAATACAQTAKYCPSEAPSVCYSVNVPSGSSGDVFFQIQGPSSQQWLGLGQGGQMAGSNIFMVYADATGKNVTVSPRKGVGNVMPVYPSGTQITVLEGSGIANGTMTANVRCFNCSSWAGGTMDLSSSKSSWIWALKDGPAISSNDQSTTLHLHTNQGSFNLDLTKAQGGNSPDPFVNAAVTSTAAGGSSPTAAASAQSPSGSGGSSSGASSGESSGGSSSASSEGSSKKTRHKAVLAHGALMGVAFVALFPLGAIAMRVLSFRGLIWWHAATQIFAYTMALAGMGLGVWIAIKPDYIIDTYHPVIGLVVISLLAFQPILGLVHHYMFKAYDRKTFWTASHVWVGRLVITLGIINGGLGMRLSELDRPSEIAYGVLAGIVWCVWLGVILWSTFSPARTTKARKTGEKFESAEGSEDGIRRESPGEKA